jgi:3-hydroxyacyl-CoA dehydrogenase
MKQVSVTSTDGIAVVQIDNPPVNALGRDVRGELPIVLAQLADDTSVDAIVIVGAGRTFVAGADIKELEEAAWSAAEPPDLHDLLRLVEESLKPIIMAMHGTALGGGLELAMAGHYRVAAPSARMGQPEVNLGIIPGAEGTQRLTRLVGIEKAIAMCVSGKPIGAGEATQAGLIDQVIEGDLTMGAVRFAREAVRRGAPHPKARDRADKLGTAESNAPLFSKGREMARTTRRHQTAPLAAIEAIEAATTLPFDEGCRRERAISLACVRSDQGRAMVHAFLAERNVAKVPDLPKDARPAEIGAVAIIGSGTMGVGIAMACANAGLRVTLSDVGREAVDRGLASIRRSYESSVTRGRLSAEAAGERLGLIQPCTGYDGCEVADLIIEAVFENLALKQQVFAEIDRHARPDCVLATNTSTLDIDQIASATGRPASVVGLHFFSPANVMRLIEIIRGGRTSSGVLATALAFAKRLGKVGVVVRNGPGFAGNRMMFPYMYEAQFLAEEGATPEQVDRVLTDWGMAMGIFAVDDMGGLDVAWRIRQEKSGRTTPFSADEREPLVADKLVEMGRLGQKTGRGWFRYGDERKPIPDPEVVDLIESVASSAGIRRRQISDKEILERTIYALINEGARVLEERVASRAADIDVIYLTGYGFPAFRGGPMFYADTVGLAVIHDRIAAFHRELGSRWKPASLLARLAREGSTFRQFDAMPTAIEAPTSQS